jgi:hypothetical protein
VSAKATLNAMTITMFESEDTALKKLLLVMVPERKLTILLQSLESGGGSKTKVLNASQAIQGKAAGVQVVSSDLQGAPSVIIRGLGTALGGRTPLYIVDGCLLRISITLIPMILLHTKF